MTGTGGDISLFQHFSFFGGFVLINPTKNFEHEQIKKTGLYSCSYFNRAVIFITIDTICMVVFVFVHSTPKMQTKNYKLRMTKHKIANGLRENYNIYILQYYGTVKRKGTQYLKLNRAEKRKFYSICSLLAFSLWKRKCIVIFCLCWRITLCKQIY